MSRGQKQRLTIACALLSDAPVLIFDEPTSGLDYIRVLGIITVSLLFLSGAVWLSIPMFLGLLFICIICAIAGGLIGTRILNRHFEKSGLI